MEECHVLRLLALTAVSLWCTPTYSVFMISRLRRPQFCMIVVCVNFCDSALLLSGSIFIEVIGASLSEPHTSVTSLHPCVCMFACLLACLD